MAKYRSDCRRVGAYDAEEASYSSGFDMSGQVSRTQQSQSAGTDINKIVKDFKVTGIVPQGVRRPTYGDFTGVSDFRSAMDAINSAERSFMSMPAAVRDRFGNDPAKFVAYCSDEKNIDQLRDWGLAVPKKPKPEPMEVRVMNETAPAPSNVAK